MPSFSQKLAVVIGINNYQHGISQLQSALNDAKEIARLLEQEHGYQVWQFLDEKASLANLNQLIAVV